MGVAMKGADMSDLVEKVARAIENAEAQNVQGFIYPDMAKAAIATVLSDILSQMRSGTFGYYPEHIIKMAVNNGIVLDQTQRAPTISDRGFGG